MYVPRCPGCAALVPPVLPAACQACGLPLVGDPAFELWEIDNRVQTLQVEIGGLLQRRSALLHELRRSAQPVRHDVPAFAVRNLLLLLGASLLAIASLVFTVVSWGGLGLPAKATILTSLAALALALPWPLARRGLNATAEAVCALGLLLVVLESYAAYSYGLFGDVDARWYTAGASLAIAVGWAAYAWVSPLRLPRPAAVVAAQFPLLLTVVALHPTVAEFASALLATSLVDLLLARRDRVALAAGAVVAIVGLLLATVNGLLVTGDLPAAVRLIPVLLGAALVGAAWAWAVDGRISAAVGIAVIFMVGVPAAAAVPAHLQGLAFAVASALVIVAGWAGPQKFSTGLWISGGFFLGASGLRALLDVAPAIVGQGPRLDAESPIIFALIAAVAFAAHRRTTGLILAALTITSIPDLAGLGLTASLAVQLTLTAGLLALAVVRIKPEDLYLALVAAAVAILWSLDGDVAEVATLSAVFLMFTATAVLLKENPVPALAAVLIAGWLCGSAADLVGLRTPVEVYTLPVTFGGLLLGLQWRRRLASSWQAYGPALAITAVPSLLLMAGTAGWARPLLLGLGALAVALTGLRARQQAPALIGGTTLLLVAAHELAPQVVQLAGLMPRWVPIAVAGLAVLALGASYERRLRELRSLHGRFSTMH